jgi:hypothetical protein
VKPRKVSFAKKAVVKPLSQRAANKLERQAAMLKGPAELARVTAQQKRRSNEKVCLSSSFVFSFVLLRLNYLTIEIPYDFIFD